WRLSMSRTSKIVAAFLVSALAVTAGGCSSSGQQAPERSKAGATLQDVHNEFNNYKAAATNTSQKLAARQPAPDVKKAYADFADAVKKDDSAAEAVRSRWEDMKTRGAEYRAKWSTAESQVSDPAVAQALEERRKKVAANYASISDAATGVR